MIKVLFGNRGVGKSRLMCTMANERMDGAKGSIVFIDKDNDHMYDLKREIRFINAADYGIDGPKMFSGFISGIAAQDFDIEAIYINSFMKLIKHPLASLEGMFSFLADFSKRVDVDLILSINAGDAPIPDFISGYLI